MVSIKELVELRDEALEASKYMGQSYKLGVFSVGRAMALWRNEEGGYAELVDHGIRFGEFSPVTMFPTSLELRTSHEESGTMEITNFDMDLDTGLTEVRRRLMTRDSPYKDLFIADLKRRHEKNLHLHVPSTDDWELLKGELERGASGAYSVRTF